MSGYGYRDAVLQLFLILPSKRTGHSPALRCQLAGTQLAIFPSKSPFAARPRYSFLMLFAAGRRCLLRLSTGFRLASFASAEYFRRSAQNEQDFDSGSEASRSPQPHRRSSSGIRTTEQTSCCALDPPIGAA